MPTSRVVDAEEPSRTGDHILRGRITQKWIEEGRAEADLEIRVEVTLCAIFTVLEVRGFEASAAQHTQLTECRDPDQLDVWLARAATVDHIDEVFA